MLKPGMTVPVKKLYDQGDIIPITEGDRESSRKMRPWDSKEEEESTLTFQRIRFEGIPEEAQNNWQSMPRNILKSMSVTNEGQHHT